jgi:hypothetical protein
LSVRDGLGFQYFTLFYPPGGAISNLYAINVARHKFFPECKHKGMGAIPHLVIYTGEQVSRVSARKKLAGA